MIYHRFYACLAIPWNPYRGYKNCRMASTPLLQACSPKIGEILIQGDMPRIEYCRKRAILQEAAG